MIGYISYPCYPEDFKAKRRYFPKVSNHRINDYIQQGIDEIILEHELGRGKDEMTHIYHIENVTITITYKHGEFHAYVKEGRVTCDAPVESEIEFQYADNLYDRDWKVMKFTEDKCRRSEYTRKREEFISKIKTDAVYLGVAFLIIGLLAFVY